MGNPNRGNGEGLGLFMLRVLQAAVMLMGGLLMLMTGMVGQARMKKNAPPLRTVLMWSLQSQPFETKLYLLEPRSGHTISLTPDIPDAMPLASYGEWVYFGGHIQNDGIGNVYRVKLRQVPELLITHHSPWANTIGDSQGQWLVYVKIGTEPEQWYSLPTTGGRIHDFTAALAVLGYNLERIGNMPVFSPDGNSIAFEARHKTDGQVHVFRASLDGSTLLNLTSQVTSSLSVVAWSDEGLILEKETEQSYYLVNAQGELRPFKFDSEIVGREPEIQFLNSGTALVDSRNSQAWIRLYRLSDMSEVWRQGYAKSFWISSSGQWIMIETFQGDWGIRQANSTQEIWFTAPPDYGIINWVRWSQDEKQLAINVEALGGHQVWRLSAIDGVQLLWAVINFINNMQWSPDGLELLITTPGPGDTETLNFVAQDGSNFHSWQGQSDIDRFQAWGPTIDRPMNGNVLTGIGVLLCSIGAGLIFARFRKV